MSEPDVTPIKKQANEKMEAALDHLRNELSAIRTGRASLSIFLEFTIAIRTLVHVSGT